MNQRKLILYISCSLDGFIAKPNDDLSFLKKVQTPGEDYGYAAFVASVDTVIVGRRTYEWVIDQGYDYPHSDKEVFVVTRTGRPKSGNVTFYTGSLADLLAQLKSAPGKDIYCDGGSALVHHVLQEQLVDELILSVIPVLLGNGIRLFNDDRPELDLELISTQNFSSGLVQMHYRASKE